jgi:cellulose synthase/poly-beta-1,6-N-acetylglucosamine synthase-like glycosyltransferase
MRLKLFWSAVGLIIYTYILFPVLVFLRGLLFPLPSRTADITPSVSMIIAAYNEANSIGAKLDNILSLDYPRDCLEVVIASDGSTDGTDEIVRSYADQGVKLLTLPRQGKAPALNAAVAASSGEVLVFSDANSMYAPEAIRALVRRFADPEVGGVAGDQQYLAKASVSSSSDGERSYWNFDRKLKQFQSRAGNVISATGAIYAIRRSLFRPVITGVTDDFVTSTSVIAQGYRLVFAADAIAYEPVAKSSSTEFGRKVRVITRGLRGVLVMRKLLNPFRYGFYALQLFSHKLLRRLVVFPLLVLMVVSPLLWWRGFFYKAATLIQAGLYGCGVLGMLLSRTRLGRLKIFTIPFYFCMVNAASLLATVNILRGQRIVLWEPQRPDAGTALTADSAASRTSLVNTSDVTPPSSIRIIASEKA